MYPALWQVSGLGSKFVGSQKRVQMPGAVTAVSQRSDSNLLSQIAPIASHGTSLRMQSTGEDGPLDRLCAR
jgi:hypothetical protein